MGFKVAWLPPAAGGSRASEVAPKGYPATVEGGPWPSGPRDPGPRRLSPSIPRWNAPAGRDATRRGQHGDQVVHRQPRPQRAGPTGRPSPAWRREKEGREGGFRSRRGGEGERADRALRAATGIPCD